MLRRPLIKHLKCNVSPFSSLATESACIICCNLLKAKNSDFGPDFHPVCSVASNTFLKARLPDRSRSPMQLLMLITLRELEPPGHGHFYLSQSPILIPEMYPFVSFCLLCGHFFSVFNISSKLLQNYLPLHIILSHVCCMFKFFRILRYRPLLTAQRPNRLGLRPLAASESLLLLLLVSKGLPAPVPKSRKLLNMSNKKTHKVLKHQGFFQKIATTCNLEKTLKKKKKLKRCPYEI